MPCVSECCKRLALRDLNQGSVQTRESTGALFSGWLECHTQLSKKAGGEVRFDAEKRKGRVLTRWDDSIFIKYLWMSSSAWREISMHCKACVSREKKKEKKNRKEKRWKHEGKKNETKRTIYLFVMKIQQLPPLAPKKERMVAVPSLGFREKCWKLTLIGNGFSLKYVATGPSKFTLLLENVIGLLSWGCPKRAGELPEPGWNILLRQCSLMVSPGLPACLALATGLLYKDGPTGTVIATQDDKTFSWLDPMWILTGTEDQN